MDPAIVSAMAAVLGSLVGGAATFATAWVTQRTLSKRELIAGEIRMRETLYGEFIRACSKLVVDSFERTLDKPETLLPAYELLNRIRLCASDAVLIQAEQVLQRITEQYFSPNLSVDESGRWFDQENPMPIRSSPLARPAAWRSNPFAPGRSREAKKTYVEQNGLSHDQIWTPARKAIAK